jgi:hypothetical protein
MSNYSQNVFFAPKDALTTGDPDKVIKGSEMDAELQEISDAIATKVEDGGVPSGSKILFFETSAPTGYTLVTGYDDRTIILADSPTDDDTPDTGGTWVVSGFTGTAASHTHLVSGTSGIRSGLGSALASGGFWNPSEVNHTHSISITSGTASSSSVTVTQTTNTWRPSWVEAIVCSKD